MAIERELRRGGAEMMILALVDERPRHGYEILKLLTERSEGVLEYHIGSVYPILFRLEERGWIRNQSESAERRKKTYRITGEGRRALQRQQGRWRQMVSAIERVAGIGHA